MKCVSLCLYICECVSLCPSLSLCTQIILPSPHILSLSLSLSLKEMKLSIATSQSLVVVASADAESYSLPQVAIAMMSSFNAISVSWIRRWWERWSHGSGWEASCAPSHHGAETWEGRSCEASDPALALRSLLENLALMVFVRDMVCFDVREFHAPWIRI